MSKKKWIISGGVIVALVAATVVGRQLTGKNSASADSSSESSEKVTTLQVAHTQNYVPYDYINEKGDSDGFEDGAYHQYADQLTWFPYKGIETYPLIHKNSTNKEFAKEYDKAVKELQEDGTIAKLSEKYFGEDVFSYVTD